MVRKHWLTLLENVFPMLPSCDVSDIYNRTLNHVWGTNSFLKMPSLRVYLREFWICQFWWRSSWRTCGSYTSVDFDARLQALRLRWDTRELKCFENHINHSPLFYNWFTHHIADVCRNHTLRSLREDVGLGCPPVPFRTNDSESINSVLKDCVGFKKQKWAVFNNIIKESVNQQQKEFEKAIIWYRCDFFGPRMWTKG